MLLVMMLLVMMLLTFRRLTDTAQQLDLAPDAPAAPADAPRDQGDDF